MMGSRHDCAYICHWQVQRDVPTTGRQSYQLKWMQHSSPPSLFWPRAAIGYRDFPVLSVIWSFDEVGAASVGCFFLIRILHNDYGNSCCVVRKRIMDKYDNIPCRYKYIILWVDGTWEIGQKKILYSKYYMRMVVE